MSITWLPREMGMVVRCNGCSAKYHTGNISATNTRAWLKSNEGWGRGSRKGTKRRIGTKRHDLCSTCPKLDKELHTQDLAAAAERKKQRDEARKAKLLPKQPKPRKPPSASPSPSADSAPAPATV